MKKPLITVRYLRLFAAVFLGGYFVNAIAHPESWHIIDGANLMFHEAGHLIFIPFPEWVTIAMGSGFQILVPLVLALISFTRREYFTGAIILMWTGQSIMSVSVYAGDALTTRLDLIGGEATTHDWNHLLWRFGLLRHTDAIASGVRLAGIATTSLGGLLSLVTSFEHHRRIQRDKKQPSP